NNKTLFHVESASEADSKISASILISIWLSLGWKWQVLLLTNRQQHKYENKWRKMI
ncbi:unnamed protein product, partial [Amoebophrya sp. A120]